jgi:acetyltransferase-like isoleucine patch superfamily enzyme
MGLLQQFVQSARRLRARAHRGVQLGAGCDLGPGVVFEPGAGRITVGADCSLAAGVVLAAYGGRIELDRWVHVGPYSTISGHAGVSIGEGTLIAMHCRILSSNHTIPPLGTLIRSQPDVLLPTRIGRDVWLGAGVTVLGGVTIGDGCVVGAGAVVTKDLAPGVIALGVPARPTGHRPTPDVAAS